MCIYMHVYVCVYVCVYTYVHVHVRVYVYAEVEIIADHWTFLTTLLRCLITFQHTTQYKCVIMQYYVHVRTLS